MSHDLRQKLHLAARRHRVVAVTVGGNVVVGLVGYIGATEIAIMDAKTRRPTRVFAGAIVSVEEVAP